MNGHQWRLKRLLFWSIPLFCALLLVLYFIGVTFHVSPKLHQLEVELENLKLPSNWQEKTDYRRDTADLFGLCENPFEHVKCPSLERKLIAPTLASDPRGYFNQLLSNASYKEIITSDKCEPTVYTGRTTSISGECTVIGKSRDYITIFSVQNEFIGKSIDIPVDVSISRR